MKAGTVVIGVGSPLMGDDGLGLAALEALRDGFEFGPDVELLDGGTWGMNLLPSLEDAERAIFIDAINRAAPPGTLLIIERAELPVYFELKISPHQVDLKDVLAVAELRGTLPQDTVAIGMQPDSVELRTSLSPLLEERLGVVVDAVVQRLQSWGHPVRRAVPSHA